MASKSNKPSKSKGKGIFMKNILTRKVEIPFQSIGSNVIENIKVILEETLYNKCSKEGYIRENSIKILSYSSGIIDANMVVFDVMFECLICNPVEGQLIKCTVKNITKAGILAIYSKEKTSPITIFIARDHQFKNELFVNIKDKDEIIVRVIGVRYELHDETIFILGELKRLPKKLQKSQKIQKKQKTKVIIDE